MADLPRMNDEQLKQVRKLIRSRCCNYDNGSCLLFDWPFCNVCPQCISYSLNCKAACDAAILKAKNAYAAIAAQAKKKKEELNRQSSRTEVAKAITDAEGLTPELVNLLIEKVYVFPDKRIEIAYKVQDLFG